MKVNPTAVLLIGVLLALPGCYAMDIDASGLQPGAYLSTSQAANVGQMAASFEVELTNSWLFWGLSELGSPDIAATLETEIRRGNGTAVTGVQIVTQQTFVDGLLSALTLGIYGRRTTIISGTVVR